MWRVILLSTHDGLPSAFRIYPCRCLCLGFSQMTRITPFRFTILHLSQIFLTEALTFTVLFLPENNSTPSEVIG
jgi:hypothetical protein